MAGLNAHWARLVRFGFYLLYNDLAPAYDLVSWLASFGRWRDWQAAAIPFVTGQDILELAFGPGHMLLRLQQAGYRVIGADLSGHMARKAAEKHRAAGVIAAIVLAPAQRLPFACVSFDTVLATFPTDFIVDPATLEEVRRVLRRGGRLVVVPQARLTGRSPAVRLLELLYRATGQRPRSTTASATSDGGRSLPQDGWTPALAPGFDARLETVSLPGSEVTIFVAEKAAEI